ncbi:beta-glucosidase [Salana multivorans]|uniref:Beta-glucosidase n=1 Tax=Salana multivorans TaxID=120377 RepID=A0A3N2DAP3_9MICO|nr:glycoside hydrolase family 3 C-terminal domain-containing protein [Salana multivorans]ROR96865.1 beta-glucosidase [Salana multivorans]
MTGSTPLAWLSTLEKAALVSGASTWETRPVPRAGLPALVLTDGPHGIRRQLGASDHLGIAESAKATCFPPAATVANSWDLDLAREIGEALGREAAEQEVDVLLGPGLNIKRNPLCGRNFEYFSEDPLLAGDLAAAYVLGIQSRGVAACPKHFAANSQETARMTSDSVVDERTLREIYLTGFERVVRSADPWALMSSYNRVNGSYANESVFLLATVLRGEWGFDGLVVSDWGGSNDAAAAVAAGSALEMPSPGFGSVREVLDALASGRLSEADLDARVEEIRRLAERTAASGAAPATDEAVQHGLARRAAAESVVLLRNEGGLLPLAAGTRVGVIGDFAETPRYQGAGSSLVNTRNLVTPLEALAASTLDVAGFSRGFPRSGAADPALVTEAVALAKDVDVVLLYLGLDELAETEGRDRATMAMAPAQLELLEAVAAVNQRVVVVLAAGSPVEMPWLSHVAALAHGYLGGEGGAEGMVDVLTGAVNPGGRLAETYPVVLADVPGSESYPGESIVEYREGPFVGYRYFSTVEKPVRFPFGFGLSYTTFAYSDLSVTSDGARVTVTNTGTVAGSDVVQLYVGRIGEGIPRPRRELKGYAKVRLAAGESTQVEIPFDEYTFRHWSTRTGAWEVETARYAVEVGANVADLPLRAELDVAGTCEPDTAAAAALPHYASGDVRRVTDAEFELLLGRPLVAAPSGKRDLGLNDPLGAMSSARNPLARWAAGILHGRLRKSEAKGKPDLNMLFVLAMPFRALAKMTNGAITTPMAEAIVRIVNGSTFGGLGALIGAWRRSGRDAKELAREFERLSTGAPGAAATNPSDRHES